MLISGRFQLSRLLGEGGMGAVWAATHVVTRKPVALKFLKGPASPETVRRFVREARAASAVRHPNVIQVHDVLTLDDGRLTMVMDLLEGESLSQRLKRLGPLSWQDLSTIMVPVLSGVGAAHAAGVIHRDLKPDNIFLSELPDGRVQPMVLDFGICKLNADATLSGETTTLTGRGLMMGTPFYMAPEQLFGDKNVDARSDVWALGVIMYESASGRRPVDGDNLGQLLKVVTSGAIVPLEQAAPDYPPAFTALINRMLASDRSQRPADLREPFSILSEIAPSGARRFGKPALRPLPGMSSPEVDSPVAVELGAAARSDGLANAVTGKRRSKVATFIWLAAAASVVGFGASWLLRSGRASQSVVAAPADPPPAIAPAPRASHQPDPPPAAELPVAVTVGAEHGQARPGPASRTRSTAAGRRLTAVAAKIKRDAGKLAGGVQGVVPF